MKTNKGFTLIELLAVIVILAIIALIATPLVLKYIEQSRKGAFERSIDAIEKAAELKMVDIKPGDISYPYEIDVKDLELKNNKDLKGTVTINENGTYTYDITNGDYNFIGPKTAKAYKVDKSVKLVFKTENGVIDTNNSYVYSFYDAEDSLDEESILDYIDVENGTLDFEDNKEGLLSTGAKIILKDNDGKVMQKYTIIIFGDVNGEGMIDGSDSAAIEWYLIYGNAKDQYLTRTQLFASDVNNDGKVDQADADMILNHDQWVCQYNQFTRDCV